MVAALALPLALAARCDASHSPPSPASTNACHEDEPCWNCVTMGNHRCDPKGRDL